MFETEQEISTNNHIAMPAAAEPPHNGYKICLWPQCIRRVCLDYAYYSATALFYTVHAAFASVCVCASGQQASCSQIVHK